MVAQTACWMVSHCANVLSMSYEMTDLEVYLLAVETEGIEVEAKSIVRH